MNRKATIIASGFLAIIVTLLVAACGIGQPAAGTSATGAQEVGSSGTGWGTGAFRSNGERIYFTATSERDTPITYQSGPTASGWMMGNGRLACASCHGTDGRGGLHNMGMMQTMNAKDIRWSALEGEFDGEKFRLAVVEGQDPDGTQLSTDMPRWTIGNEDLADLIAYLKTLP